jgi:septum formation topological specificity factor MinE
VDERERQRACRARRRGQEGVVSRPGLAVEVPVLQRDLLEIVDRYVELSRTGLRREMARLLRCRAPILGQNAVAGP